MADPSDESDPSEIALSLAAPVLFEPERSAIAVVSSMGPLDSEEWKLKHRSLREGIQDPGERGGSGSGHCSECKPDQVSAYYEKQFELLDGLQVHYIAADLRKFLCSANPHT